MYPTDWKQLRANALERAGHKCEWCGVPNKQLILRHVTGDGFLRYDVDNDVHYTPDGEPVRLSEFPEGYEDSQYITINLSIANTTYDTMDYPEDATALCQHCRAKHDAPMRARKEAAKRQHEQEQATGQLKMFE